MFGSKRFAGEAILRFFNRRRILGLLSGIVIAMLVLAGAVVLYFRSSAFNERASRYIVQEIQQRTGANVSLKNFGWSFWRQRLWFDDLILRGLEPSGEAPLAHFTRIDVGLNFRTLVQRRINLFELTFSRPEFHILVTPDGRTNFPSPPQPQGKPTDFEISIKNFNVLDGSAVLNEQRVNVDLSLTNLAAILNYQAAREVLQAHLSYDGVLDRSPDVKQPIPYTLSAELDYTRATLVAQRILVTSGRNEIKLQGRVNQLLSTNIAGKLDYTANVELPFLNYFFTLERFGGKAAAAGFLEFSRGYFLTQGNTASDVVDFEGWRATKFSGEYTYRYPDRRLTFRKLKTMAAGGALSGNAVVENLPGPSRVNLDLGYAGVDAAALTRAYPWDPKYRIFSNATGTLKGWFEGKLVRFDFSGHVDLKSYPPAPTQSVVALPVDGSTNYEIRPGQARVSNADVRFYSTAVKADGLIHPTVSDMKVIMNSSNLKDAAFLYSDANGSGSFDGTLTGRIARPVLNGEFTIQNHAYRRWKIQQAAGGVRLDTEAETADLRNVRVTQGESQVLINGSAALSGSPVDLRVQSNRVTAQDLRPFVDRDIGGLFAGDVHVTSLSPNIKLEGDVRADNLSVENRSIGNTRGYVRYFEPLIEVDQLSIRKGDSTLTGNVSFNRATDALKFTARVISINLEMFHPLGLPDSVQGIMRQADLQGDGTTAQPNIRGNATIENLSVYGEAFPQARVDLSSMGTRLNVRLDAGRSVSLTAQIDTATKGYPFTARANFTQYPLERIAKFSDGTISATGNANLSGLLTDQKRLRGDGLIESADIRIRQMSLRTTKPFMFDVNADQLKVTGVTLAGQSTLVNLAGTIGFAERAPLNLDVSGQIDLALVSAEYPGLTSGGTVNVQVGVRGTVQRPDLRGIAHFANASLGRRGLYTSVTNLNGDLFFNQDQIRLNNVEGRVGGGTVRAQGTTLLQGGTIQGMNVEIDADSIRVRGYPEGLRTVLDGRLVLRGSWTSPLLQGNIQIESLAYRSSFEEFLTLLTEPTLNRTPSPIGRLRLSLHIEGGRNITIQNPLADVEARVDVDLKGTVDEPSVTGHIEASGGTLLFQGNRYTVTRGNIDFIDPLRIQPVIDIEAESQVRDYRVILSITGRGDNPKLAIRSDPPLPELEIVSLIAGGRSREEIASRSTKGVPTSEQLFQSGAASILLDLLQQRVGNRLGLLGAGRVRIDPFLVGAENNPGARITLSEQVTKDLSITYSQDLSSNRQQVILIEYFVSRNTSVVASRDELGNFGLDLRHRTRIK
jgi:translocation and assembly module TamB